MGRELSHAEVRDLLGAFAVDAVDGDEHDAVERHLETCPPCRAEVAEHREVVALMAAAWTPAPDGLWDKIASSLEENPPAMRPVVPLAAERAARRGGWGGGLRGLSGLGRGVAAVGVAASVAVMGVLAVNVINTGNRVDKIGSQLSGDALVRAANAAASRDDARHFTLTSTDGKLSTDGVLLPDGTGFLTRTNLPALSVDRTYQLWAVVGTSKISVGVLGSSPGPVAFHTSGGVSALAITDEVVGGVVASQQTPTVIGTLTA